ncbi:MAG: hypothetical protein PHF42_05235 [Pseudomonas sp.]|nr:hypothetical protein [Pseudomonas sp.]
MKFSPACNGPGFRSQREFEFFENGGIVESIDQTTPRIHENENQEKPLRDCSNSQSSQNQLGQSEPKSAGGSANHSQSDDVHCNDMGSRRSDSGQLKIHSNSVGSATRVGSDDYGRTGNDRITTAIDGREIDKAILPMLVFYLAFHAKAGKRELSNHWIASGKSQEQVRQWFHELHCKWRIFVICSYGGSAAVCFIARRILGDSVLASMISVFGAIMLTMAIASAIYFYSSFNLVVDHNED